MPLGWGLQQASWRPLQRGWHEAGPGQRRKESAKDSDETGPSENVVTSLVHQSRVRIQRLERREKS
jgi:hypothetical protein